MAQLLKTEITGSLTDTGSLIISGSQPVQLPALTSGSGDVDPELITNQFWFDQGDNTIKYSVIGSFGTGVWNAGPNLITTRRVAAGGGGSNDGFIAGGLAPGGGYLTSTEEISNNSWTAGGNLNTARGYFSGNGNVNAGIVVGGAPGPVTCTEEYNGSTWANGGALITARNNNEGVAGTQNSTLMIGGQTPTVVSCTEEYNGSSWSTGGVLSTARYELGSATGTQNAGLATGGNTPSRSSAVEKYDGSAWSTSTSTPATINGGMGGGTQNDTVQAMGGLANASYGNQTQGFDGTAWSICANSPSTKGNTSGGGTSNNIMTAGGSLSGVTYTNTNDNFERPFLFPFSCCLPGSSTWSSGGALITARYRLAGGGQSTQNSSIVFGGRTPTIVTCTEEYNGTAWSAQTGLILARSILAGAGSEPAALAFGGYTPGSPSRTETEEYNGSAWGAGGALIAGRSKLSGNGTQNDALATGGESPNTNKTEEYNGTAWTTGGTLITARYSLTAAGASTNAAIVFGGYIAPVASTSTEEYNGSSWSTGGAMINTRNLAGGAGILNAALAFAGYGSPYVMRDQTETYDGTSWSADSAMITARNALAGTGTTQANAVAIGGQTPTILANTELYTPPVIICTNTYKCNLSSVSVWNTGGNLSTAFYGGVQVGSPTAALAMGGYNQSPVGFLSCTQNYNGTSWGQTGALINCRAWTGASGTQNAAVLFGGTRYPNQCNATEEFNGSAWSAGNVSPAPASFAGSSGTGTQNAALQFGGNNPTTTSCTIAYDGTNWSARNNMITGGHGHGTGTQNSAIKIGRRVVNTFTSITEEYDGSTWSTADPAPINQGPGNQAGVADAALYFGGAIGNPGQYLASTQFYNGVSWATKASLSVGRYNGGGSTRSTSGDNAMFAGGNSGFPNIYQGSFCTENYTDNDGESVFFNRDTCVRCITGTCTQIS